MLLLSSGRATAQLITVLFIFVAILAVTAWVTKWLADYQKAQNAGRNIEVLETTRIANGGWIQLVRIGTSVKAVAISKDRITYLGDIDPDSLQTESDTQNAKTSPASFSAILERMIRKNPDQDVDAQAPGTAAQNPDDENDGKL